MKYFAYSQKEFVYKYIVMLSDIDQFKHMSFANYLKLMFLATDALLLSAANHEDIIQKYRLKTYATKMQFKSQTVFGDNVLIKVNASNIEQDRFDLLFTYAKEDSNELVALGKQSLGSVGCNSDVPIETPADLARMLQSIKVDEQNLLYQYS